MKFKCEFCPKTLTTKQGIKYHEDKCIFRNELTKDKPSITKDQQPILKDQPSIINNNIINQTASTINNTTNNTTIKDNQFITYNNITITINDFNCECKEKVLKDTFNISESLLTQDIERIIKLLHFNPYDLQNSNVRLHNNDEKSEFLEIMKRGKWQQNDKSKTLIDMIKHAYAIFLMYEIKTRNQLEQICRDQNVSYFDLMDWIDAGNKHENNIDPTDHHDRIIKLMIAHDILLKNA